MKLIITRTSLENTDEKPYSKAYPIEVESRNMWAVDIKNFKELIEVVEKTKIGFGVLIQKSDFKKIPFKIEIYDSYRE